MTLWYGCNGLLLLVGYLLGSLPIGYLLGRLLKGIDIREHGSGSTGATNVLRVLGRGPGLLVLSVDVGKGALAIALVRWFYQNAASWLTQTPEATVIAQWLSWMVVLVGLMTILGHSKSIWLNFTGGKSVAASLGILLVMHWQISLLTLGVFLVSLALTRIVSISSISGAIALPILMLLWQQPIPYVLFGILGGVYVIWRHQSNIQRLLQGTEPRLGQVQPEAPSAQP